MMRLPAFDRDAYLRDVETEILKLDRDGERSFAVLGDTVIYPEGGGQPSDRGWLGPVGIEEAQRHGDEIRHFYSGALQTGPVRVVLDWPRRYDHMQQHSAQHILTSVALRRCDWSTRSFHIGPEVSDIELATPLPGDHEIAELEEAVAVEIRAARPISTRWVGERELAGLEVRSRGLPAGHSGEVRLVEIAGLDLNTCGGTHVASTAEVECLKIVRVEPLRGGCRLSWVAGGRVRLRLGLHEARLTELRRALDTGDAELIAAVERRGTELRAARRDLRELGERLVPHLLTELASGDARISHLHLDGPESTLLRSLVEAASRDRRVSVALVTATHAEDSSFALAAGPECALDPQELGREVAEILGGRGGGGGRVFQGRAPSLEQLEAAVVRLREVV